MPAVTVDDLSALPSITLPSGDAAGSSGPVPTRRVHHRRPRRVRGRRISRCTGPFAGVGLDRLDPFVHMDQIG